VLSLDVGKLLNLSQHPHGPWAGACGRVVNFGRWDLISIVIARDHITFPAQNREPLQRHLR
jgi:hypothetical protein